MKPCVSYLLILGLIYSCQPHKIAIKNPPKVETIKLTSPTPLKSTWNSLMTFVFKHGYAVKSGDEKTGILILKMENIELTTLNKSGEPDNKNAIAFTEVIRKGNNPKHLFARKGTIEFDLLVQSFGEQTSIFFQCKNKGILTEYYQNGFTVNKPIKDINVWSTGVFEKMVLESTKTD